MAWPYDPVLTHFDDVVRWSMKELAGKVIYARTVKATSTILGDALERESAKWGPFKLFMHKLHVISKV